MKVLITGGAGFIGSTIGSCCIEAGIEPVILDDLSAGREEFAEGRTFYRGDVADRELLGRIFDEHDIDAVVHCAAKIVVPESVDEPSLYYDNNVTKSIELMRFLEQRGGDVRFLFSSSASVYSSTEGMCVDESSGLAASSPYARTKMIVDLILEDVSAASDTFRSISLRYFNPVGADPEGRTGHQDPAPTHVLAKLIQAKNSGRPFTLTGVDWPTRDGSAIRDYIHVWDLARAHVHALQRFDDVATADTPHRVINLGTGTGTTVRELLGAFETVTGEPLEMIEGEPRPGDVIGCYTDAQLADELLDWRAELSLEQAMRDALAWDERRSEVLGA